MTPATAPVLTPLPEWVYRLRAEGGEETVWISIPKCAAYLPMGEKTAYRACERYLARIERERKRRHSHLLPVDVLDAKADELPCMRTGRNILLSKWRLERFLLGFEA